MARKGNDLTAWREELDTYYGQMQDFASEDPAEIFTTLAAMTSRVSYIRSMIVRQESRILQNFRTKEVDPFIIECDRQFKLWSRVASVTQFEIDQAGRV